MDTCPRNDLEAAPIVPCLDIDPAETLVVLGEDRIEALGEDQVIRGPPQ